MEKFTSQLSENTARPSRLENAASARSESAGLPRDLDSCTLIRLSQIPSSHNNEPNNLEQSPHSETALGPGPLASQQNTGVTLKPDITAVPSKDAENASNSVKLDNSVVPEKNAQNPSNPLNLDRTGVTSPNMENSTRILKGDNPMSPSKNLQNTSQVSASMGNPLGSSSIPTKPLGSSSIPANNKLQPPIIAQDPSKIHTGKGFCRITNYTQWIGENRVMLRWKSSIWKLLWKELLIYTVLYFIISLFYRYALDLSQQKEMEKIILWLGSMYTGLPLTFILGFYVSLVVNRWWSQYCKLPWPDTVAMMLRCYVPGPDEQIRMLRRTVIRYCLLSYVLCVKRMSARLRKRFPTMQEVMRTGLLRPDEYARIGEEDHQEMYESNWWIPIRWCTEILSNAEKTGLVVSPPAYNGLTAQVAAFRHSLTEVATYGHIPIPLVYTQVVKLAVYIYFGVALIGEQWIIDRGPHIAAACVSRGWNSSYIADMGETCMVQDEIDLRYPIFTSVKFLFYFGWLRVADTLYNPFGEDDDDFDLNGLLDRHLRVGMSIVNQSEKPPELKKDIFWGQNNPELVDCPRWDEMYAANFYSKPIFNVEKRDPML